MDLPDLFRLLEKDLRRPQIILEVTTAALQLGGESAVDHKDRIMIQDGFDWIHIREDTIFH
jgi:hypothetical protein